MALTLIHAAADGNLDLVKRLIEKHVDVNVTDQDGRTALHEAFSHRKEDVARFLISKGASCVIKDRKGSTPCSVAVHLGLAHVVPSEILDAESHRPGTGLSSANQ